MVFKKEEEGGDAQFNQAAFQQSRLNDLFSQIDRMSNDLFSKDIITGRWCYELVFNNLNSVLSTISPKLTTTKDDKLGELELLDKFRSIIRSNLALREIFKNTSTMLFSGQDNKTSPNMDNRNIIYDLLFQYRLAIEKVMDIHGLSNPDKESEGGWD